ncbi:MAG: RHS repeat-associated core domain-containing protein [Bacteroidales bacterium]|nr:RHS repeat-associated core domain-containing protein [Bacteroidales bacterium]
MVFGCVDYSYLSDGTLLRRRYDSRSRQHYWHLTNNQGSVMAVVDGRGKVVQRSGLYPSGTPFVLPVDISADTVTMRLGAVSDRLHIGNRWQSHSGLNWYDNTARMHDPLLLRFTTQDPLAGKNSDTSPYAFCHGNPVMFIDPDGKDGVRIVDDDSKTITIKANYYVATASVFYPGQDGKIEELKGYTAKDIEKMNGYNDYLNKLKLKVPSGEYDGYSVNFDLSFIATGQGVEAEFKAAGDTYGGHPIGNTIRLGNEKIYSRLDYKHLKFGEKDNGDGITRAIGGMEDKGKDIVMNKPYDNKMNRLHEIFHTLGLTHPPGVGGPQGIMKYPPDDPTEKDALELSTTEFLPTIKNDH